MAPPTQTRGLVGSAFRHGIDQVARNPLPALAGIAFHGLALLLGVGAVSRFGVMAGAGAALLPALQAMLNGRQLENRLRRYDGEPQAARPSYMLPSHPISYGLTALAFTLCGVLFWAPLAASVVLVIKLPGTEARIQDPTTVGVAHATGFAASCLCFIAYALTSFARMLALDLGLWPGRAIAESWRRSRPYQGAMCRFLVAWGALQGLAFVTGGIGMAVTVPVGSYALIDLYRRVIAPRPAPRKREAPAA